MANKASHDQESLEGLLDTALDDVDGNTVSVADLLSAFGDRSFGPVITILGLFIISPLGAIPGLPAAVALVIVLIAGQMALGRSYLWLPSRLLKLDFSKEKIDKFNERARGTLSTIDKLITQRLRWATRDTSRRVAATVCIALALTMIPLELVPFAVALPGVALIMIGLAITSRDGVLMILGLGLSGVAFAFALSWLVG